MTLLLMLACAEEPIVYIASPAEGEVFTVGEVLEIEAFAARGAGELQDIETVVSVDSDVVFSCGPGHPTLCQDDPAYTAGTLRLDVPLDDEGFQRVQVTSRLFVEGAASERRAAIVEIEVQEAGVIEPEPDPADALAETCPPEDQDAASVTAVELADDVLALALTYGGTDSQGHAVSLCWDAASDAADLVFQLAHDGGDDAGDTTVNDTLRVDVAEPLDAFQAAAPDATQVQVLIQVPDGAGGYTEGQVYALAL